MMRFIAGLRIALVAMALVAVAACSSKDKPDVANQGAVPGSERDFIVNVGDRVQFIVDQTTLTPEAQNILRRQAQWLQQYGQVTVQIEGHADERGTREYNIALSARRAERVKNFLISQGIAASRVSTIAFGKERPVSLCDAESCWAKNRRAVTVITGGAVSG